MRKQFVRRAAIVVLATAVTGTADGQTEEIVRTIPLEPGGRFTLSNMSGDVAVAGADGAAVTLRATKRLVAPGSVSEAVAREAFDRVAVEVRERGDRVAVETEYPRRGLVGRLADLFRGGRTGVAVDYDVTVPRGVEVAIESISGAVTVEGVDGETRVETVSGDVRLASLARLTDVEMVSGDLRMTDVGSDDGLSAEAVSGRIVIDGIRAPRLDVSTVSGTLALTRVEARRVDVETVSGPVAFEGAIDADGRYEFQTHSGRIRVTVPAGTGFDVEARSFSGSFDTNAAVTLDRGHEDTVETEPEVVWRTSRAGRRELDGTVGGGGGRLGLSTFSGDMTVEVGGTP